MNKNERSSKKKSIQLGMSHGTASHRLKKNVLFDLLKQLKKNVCYRCNREIEIVSDLSIDHKEPWLNSGDPKGKFFDLDNISFSHLSCNCGNARQPNKIIPPEGMEWCKYCKNFKPLDNFPENYKHHRCKDCHSNNMASWRKRTGKH